jgi:ribonucleoside-diphosphate reductase alpha chain
MTVNYHGLTLHPERNERLSDLAGDLLRGFYLREGETIQQAFARPALAFSGGDDELAQDIYDDVSRGWAMYSSPILSNAPAPGEIAKAMPISCFLGFVPDTREGLVDHQKELAWLSMLGGGVGGHWSAIRAVSDKSVGPIPHMKVADSAVEGFRQGRTRKGSYAAYLDISHPDVVEFLNIRLPTGGDVNRKCFNIHHAINITDVFMRRVFAGASWDLVCPHSGKVVETVDARELWQSILDTRFRTGEPYLNFIDTANRFLPESQQALGLRVHGSNLCNEIHLPTDGRRTAVCCLSSVNLERYDEWKHDPQFIKRWVRFLDNVLTFFIENAPEEMSKAIYSASRERAIGLGAMGFHSLLHSKMIPWESPMAKALNARIFRHIKAQAEEATFELASERGEAPDMAGTGRRNSHLLAIAPNANSGLICGTSPSIEPLRSNAFTQRTRAGSHLVINPHLKNVIRKYAPAENSDEWVKEQIQRVVLDKGSVKELEYLTDFEKEVFKTAPELDQRWVVDLAADRQEHICQGQSVNLYFPFGAQKRYVNETHLMAYQRGLKGLYYLRTDSGFTGDKVSVKLERKALKDFNAEEECVACQG